MQANLQHVVSAATNLDHKVLKQLYYFITAIIINVLWREKCYISHGSYLALSGLWCALLYADLYGELSNLLLNDPDEVFDFCNKSFGMVFFSSVA